MSTFYEPTVKSDELYHHGVLGMKWGVHRARKLAAGGHHEAAKKKLMSTYEKSSRKIEKMDKKINKLQAKAVKKQQKADRNAYGWFGNQRKAKRLNFKASRLQYKANKKAQKAQKFLNQMNKTYSNTSIKKLSPRQQALGEKYKNMLIERSRIAM